MKIKVKSESETGEIAARVAGKIEGGWSVGLIGQLGAGKTAFARHLIAALGGGTGAASPSYVLCLEHRLPRGAVVEHWDLYRVSAVPEELLEPPGRGQIRLIEWVDKFPALLSEMEMVVSISAPECANRERREISILGELGGDSDFGAQP